MAALTPTRSERILSAAAVSTIILISLVTITFILFAISPRVFARTLNPPTLDQTTSNTQERTQKEKDQEERINLAIIELKERAATQQTLINSLAGLTGLYVVILTLASYLRLQQAKEDTKITLAKMDADQGILRSDMEKRIDATTDRLKDLIAEVRLDVPAIHGIGRRLEYLLAELQIRLPVDGDWTEAETYGRLASDQREQALVDEMVINAMEIFNISQDVANSRTVSALYLGLGHFYFGKAVYTRAKSNKADAVLLHCRADLYLNKAVEADSTNPVAHRARAVSTIWSAIWKQEDEKSIQLNEALLAKATRHIQASLNADPEEPGALFAASWLLRRQQKHDESIEQLNKLIALEQNLRAIYKRKFLYAAFLNRATNRAFRLANTADPTKDYVNSEIKLIDTDCREALRLALQHQRKDTFQNLLKREIETGGDLAVLYTVTPDLRVTIDQILTN